MSSFVEGQVTEVVEGKAWVVPGVLSPEVSPLSVGSPFFIFTMSSWWGQTIMILGNIRITTSISVTNTTITQHHKYSFVIIPTIDTSRIIII